MRNGHCGVSGLTALVLALPCVAQEDPSPWTPHPGPGQPLLCPEETHPTTGYWRTWSRGRELLLAGEYAELDELLRQVKAAGRPEGKYSTNHASILSLVVAVGGAEAHVRAWVAQSPDSFHAQACYGKFMIQHAWDARGSGWANSVTEERWKLFFERLRTSRAALIRAAELAPEDPLPWTYLITVGMGLDDEELCEQALEEAVARDPNWIEPYKRRLYSLKPRWGGALDRMRNLIQKAIRRAPDEPAMLLLWWEYFEEDRARMGPPPPEWRWYFNQRSLTKHKLRDFDEVPKRYPNSPNVQGKRFQLSRYRDEPDAEQLEWARRAADLFVPEAMAELGQRYAEGRGVEKDVVAAARWYCRAATDQDTRAMRGLAALYDAGELGKANPREAKAWLRKAMELGDMDAVVELGQLFLRSGAALDGFSYLRSAARAGHAEAMGFLGELYLGDGPRELPVDIPMGLRLLAEATNRGASRFYMRRAQCADDGVGGPPNPKLAAHLYRQAWRAKLPDAEAAFAAHLEKHPEFRRESDLQPE